jgi:predicted AlkP superfamily pyrophosphatase or phosphodiesterase
MPSISPEDPDFSIMGSDWYWEKKHVRVPTLPDLLFEQGRSVATVLWPVTAGEKRGFNLPEIWPPKGAKKDGAREIFARACSDNVMEAYYDDFVSKYDWSDNEDMIGYSVEVALDIVRRHAPDLLLCHLTHLDHARHLYGVHGREVDGCLRQLDVIAGRFAEATPEGANIVILGDHGQIGIDKIFNLNALFREAGLIHTNPEGKVLSYDAYSFSAGFSAHIMLKDPSDRPAAERLETLLRNLPERYPEYIETVYTAEEIYASERLSGEFSHVVEAREGVLLPSDITDEAILPLEKAPPRYRNFLAMHGHHPSKGEKPPFIAFGPDIKKGARIENGDMMDIAPTLAALLNVTLPRAKGRPFPVFA